VSAEDFEFAVAVAGTSIGLVALLLLAIVSLTSTWGLFRQAGRASEAATRSHLAMEELARRLARPEGPAPARPPEIPAGEELAELRRQAEDLMEHQSRLQETMRNLIESGVLEAGAPAESLQNLEQAVRRLESTVSQMAAAMANLMQQVERRGT